MKISVIIYLLFPFLLFLVACNNKEGKIDGAYENVSTYKTDSVLLKNDASPNHIIKIFKNGYWINISVTPEFVLNCSGGTYRIINGTHIEKYNFNSSDTSVIGKELKFNYYLNADHLVARLNTTGIHEKDDHRVVYDRPHLSTPLKNTFLEGAWTMKPGQGGYNTNNNEVVKIFAYPFFITVIYNTKEKKIGITYVGNYQFDGKNLIETIKYSFSDITSGSAIEWDVKKLSNNEIQLFDIDSQYDEEIYEKSNNPL